MIKPKICRLCGVWFCYTEGLMVLPIYASGDSPQSAYAEWHRIATMGNRGR